MIRAFLFAVPPCLLFCIAAYATELAWKAKDAEKELQLKRRIMEPDTRPFFLGIPVYPWKHSSWFGLNGVEASPDGRERSTRRGL